jgi:GMP synthase-like glutamine amidotransferase
MPMKPVLVLQNLTADGPAYLRRWLEREGLPFEVHDTQRGDAYPARVDAYGALALLGGEMSANDELPALRQAEALAMQAFEAGIPVLGHCLGGQLMAKALGARIGPSPRPEIGWHTIRIDTGSSEARAWFGDAAQQRVFQWHGEAFELPAGAQALAGSDACPHQAFAFGPHLAMQFHVELDAQKLAVWARADDPTYVRQQQLHPQSVQSPAQMLRIADEALAEQQRLADRIYGRWIALAG